MELVAIKHARGRHRKSSEWRELIDKYERSGQSTKLFCEKENLSSVTLLKWRNRFRAEVKLRSAKSDSGVVGSVGSNFVEISGGVCGEVESYAELSFPCGLTLRVRG